jgi:hypothetical protein
MASDLVNLEPKQPTKSNVFILQAIVDLQDEEQINFPYVPSSVSSFVLFQQKVKHSIPIKFYIYLKFLIKQAKEPNNINLSNRVAHVQQVFNQAHNFDSLIKLKIKSNKQFDHELKCLLWNTFCDIPFIGIGNCSRNTTFFHKKISKLVAKLLCMKNTLEFKIESKGFTFKKFFQS